MFLGGLGGPGQKETDTGTGVIRVIEHMAVFHIFISHTRYLYARDFLLSIKFFILRRPSTKAVP
jgi:hypothetical protein